MFNKKVKIEDTKNELELANRPKSYSEELFKITIEQVKRVYKEDTENKYFDLTTKKEIGWSEYYKKSEDPDESISKTVIKIDVPNGDYSFRDTEKEIYSQIKKNLNVEGLVVSLNNMS